MRVTTVCRLVIAAVLAVAGSLKLRDPRATRRSMEAFGLSRRTAALVAALLPLGELGLAIALPMPATATLATYASFVLLGAFTVVVARALGRGSRPACPCFGVIGARPISGWTLARNIVLLAVAAGAALLPSRWDVQLSAPRASTLQLVCLALAFLAAAELVLLVRVLRRHGNALAEAERLRVALRAAGIQPDTKQPFPEPLPIGTAAPDVILRRSDASELTVASLLGGERGLAVAFTDDDCSACAEFLSVLPSLQREYEDVLHVVLITRVPPAGHTARHDYAAIRDIIAVTDDSAMKAFGVRGVPAALIIDARGAISSAVAFGPDEIERLLARFARAARQRHSPVLTVSNPI